MYNSTWPLNAYFYFSKSVALTPVLRQPIGTDWSFILKFSIFWFQNYFSRFSSSWIMGIRLSRCLVYPFVYAKHARAFRTQIDLHYFFLFRPILVRKAGACLAYPNWSQCKICCEKCNVMICVIRVVEEFHRLHWSIVTGKTYVA